MANLSGQNKQHVEIHMITIINMQKNNTIIIIIIKVGMVALQSLEERSPGGQGRRGTPPPHPLYKKADMTVVVLMRKRHARRRHFEVELRSKTQEQNPVPASQI